LSALTSRRPDLGANRAALPLVVALLTYAAVIAAGPRILDDPDTFLHVAVGQWIIAHGVPHADVFSHTMRGAPWVADEWLSEVGLAFAYKSLGWEGLILVTAAAFAATLGLLARSLQRVFDPVYVLIAVVAAAGLSFPHLTARPHVLALPLLVLWTDGLVRARQADRAASPWLAVVIALWANLHGSFVLGLLLALLFAGEALYDAPDRNALWRAARGWGVFLGLAVLASCVTPNGVAGLLLPFHLVGMTFALAILDEWQSPNFQELQPVEFWLLLVLLGILSKGVRLPLTRIVMFLVLLHLALEHKRFVENLGLVAPLLAAPLLAPQLPRLVIPALQRAAAVADRKIAILPGLALLGALALALTISALRIGVTHGNGYFAPVAALDAVDRQHVSGPVFNDLGFGSYLIFSGVPTFVDSRVELYGDGFLRRYETVANLPGLLTRYNITWTLLPPQNPRVAVMDLLPGWHRLYTDDFAVVHVRDATAMGAQKPQTRLGRN
jgi:hypothetical protein